jgi:DNA-binding HxlR family transcriptional regulator
MNAIVASDTGPLDDAAASCPIDTAISIIAGRWKLLLLRPLYLHGPLRYSELLRQVAPITAKELTRNLHELEYAGLVCRTGDADGGAYVLTDLGRSLGATFQALGQFGTAYLDSRRPLRRG